MKNTKKDIIERFQSFDFDPNEINQKQIFSKLTVPAIKRKPKRLVFALVAACGLVLAVFVAKDNIHKEYYGIGKFAESDISMFNLQTEESEKPAESKPESEEQPAGIYYVSSVEEEPKAKPSPLTAPASAVPASVRQDAVKAEYAERKQEAALAEEKSVYYSMQTLDSSNNKLEMSRESKAYRKLAPTERANSVAAKDEYAVGYEKRAVLNAPKARAKQKAVYKSASVSESKVIPGGSRLFEEADYNSMRDESYKKYEENTFRSTISDPFSTFSADVDMASYNIVRQIIMSGRNPNPDSVRIEEFLNYFEYSYPQPEGSDPVSMNFEYTDSPWNKDLKLVKIGVKAKDIEKAQLPPSNLVFLIDVSGSMHQENRLPLVKKSMRMLINELRPEDRVSVVTYANGVNEIISGAKGGEKERIIDVIEDLNAGGGTSGSEGLAIAYETAKKNFIRKGNNRVILATDGDFNIGPRSESELENQITEARDSGVFLSVLGYGMGNYKDSKMQALANKGNGNYAYINDLFEAKKVLVKEFGATLFTVAKDVKLQVEFNPALVSAYRLVGYEKRALNTQDFNDDKKDAGEMGAGHTVTVIYEIIPAGVKSEFMPDVDALKYTKTAPANANDDVLTLKLRYKEPDSDRSKLMEKELKQKDYRPFDKASDDMRFAASVVQFGQILKNSHFKGSMTIDEVIMTAKKSKGADEEGYRSDFIKMLEMYNMIRNDYDK